MKMHYTIVTNPVAGKMSVTQKRSLLAEPAEILNAEIYGLDTTTVEDFYQCVRELPGRCDVVVVAGGDGTLSESDFEANIALGVPRGSRHISRLP
jgi:diacylglycerol kinase family enzyme